MSEHKNVFVALSAAQAKMELVKKGAVNPAFKGEGKPRGTPYADLADVVQAVSKVLSENGIAFYHYIPAENPGVMVTALVHGVSDTRLECAVPLIVSKQDMQGFKSATTYAKRIGLESVTGVAPEDDDGNAAAKAAPKAEARATITEEQFRTLRGLIEESGSDEAKFTAHLGVDRLPDLLQSHYETAAALLRKKIAAKAAA